MPVSSQLIDIDDHKFVGQNASDVSTLLDTARLDIGKRFKRMNITQTVPNVSSYVS